MTDLESQIVKSLVGLHRSTATNQGAIANIYGLIAKTPAFSEDDENAEYCKNIAEMTRKHAREHQEISEKLKELLE